MRKSIIERFCGSALASEPSGVFLVGCSPLALCTAAVHTGAVVDLPRNRWVIPQEPVIGISWPLCRVGVSSMSTALENLWNIEIVTPVCNFGYEVVVHVGFVDECQSTTCKARDLAWMGTGAKGRYERDARGETLRAHEHKIVFAERVEYPQLERTLG